MNSTSNIHKNGDDKRLNDLFGKNMPYEVPEGYFDELPERVMSSVRQAPSSQTFIKRSYRYIFAAAAALIMAAMVITMVFSERSSEDDGLEAYSISDIYQYNINSLAELEEAYLLTLIDNDSLDMIGLMGYEKDSITDEIIMEYLLAENHIEYHIINEK